MSSKDMGVGVAGVGRNSVRALTRATFLAASVLFLGTIGLGFLNVVTTGEIPKWQAVTHLHSGTVGWILLSFVGVAIWLFADEWVGGEGGRRRLWWLVGAAVVAFAGLAASFGYGFSQGDEAMVALGIAAPAAALVVWSTALYALTRLRAEVVATTARLLVAVGLLLAAIGVTVGAYLGMTYAFDGLATPPEETIGAHFLTVLPAVSMVSAGILEWLVRGEAAGPASRAGVLQVGVGAIAGLMFPTGFTLLLLGVPASQLEPIFMGLLGGGILFILVFLVRIGHHALRRNPFATGSGAWVFFSTVWFLVFLPSVVLPVIIGGPEWTSLLSIHGFFVGFVTCAILGAFSMRTRDAAVGAGRAEPTAVWLVNLGIVAFVAGEAVAGVAHGAVVMGLGVLLGLAVMSRRLLTEGTGWLVGQSAEGRMPD